MHPLRAFRRQLPTLLAVLGQGIIVIVADNDPGSLSTYAVTGSAGPRRVVRQLCRTLLALDPWVLRFILSAVPQCRKVTTC